MRSSLVVDYENLNSGLTEGAPIFYGSDLEMAPELTVFGEDLPGFSAWALKNGTTGIRRVTDSVEYAKTVHALVAHDFGAPVSLNELEPLRGRIGMLLEHAARLLLFVEITDHCTIEDVRRALRSTMPDLTFRVVYPRGVNNASGLRIFTAERRRPRIFLFASSHPMAGKTESALALSDSTGIKVVHVDGTVNGILRGEIAAPDDVRNRAMEMFDASPLDPSLFAAILALVPEMDEEQDLILDLLMPIPKQTGLMAFFHQRGFFPILCISRADRLQISTKMEEVEEFVVESERLRAVAESKARQLAADAARLTDETAFLRDKVTRLTADEARLTGEAALLRGTVARLTADAANLTHEVALRAIETGRLAAEVESYKAQAAMYRNSTSWKLTAPLRYIGDRLPLRRSSAN